MEMNKAQQTRSLSLPSKLNPINQKIETQLKKLRIKEESATSASERIINGVSGLSELYECINKALSLPMTQQALSLSQHEKHVGVLLKRCSSLLNICGSIMEIVQLQCAITKLLKSSLSESKEDTNIETNIGIYTSTRKEVIKKAKNVVMTLNQLLGEEQEEECNASTLIKSLRCVSIINLSVFESLLNFESLPVSKPKRTIVSKLMNKGSACKFETGNQINDVDNVLHELVLGGSAASDDMLCIAITKLKGLVGVMESLQTVLNKMSHQLIQTKAFLMNIVSF